MTGRPVQPGQSAERRAPSAERCFAIAAERYRTLRNPHVGYVIDFFADQAIATPHNLHARRQEAA